MLQMDHAKLLDILTSISLGHAILPGALCFAMSRPANHATCSYISGSGYASEMHIYKLYKSDPEYTDCR